MPRSQQPFRSRKDRKPGARPLSAGPQPRRASNEARLRHGRKLIRRMVAANAGERKIAMVVFALTNGMRPRVARRLPTVVHEKLKRGARNAVIEASKRRVAEITAAPIKFVKSEVKVQDATSVSNVVFKRKGDNPDVHFGLVFKTSDGWYGWVGKSDPMGPVKTRKAAAARVRAVAVTALDWA